MIEALDPIARYIEPCADLRRVIRARGSALVAMTVAGFASVWLSGCPFCDALYDYGGCGLVVALEVGRPLVADPGDDPGSDVWHVEVEWTSDDGDACRAEAEIGFDELSPTYERTLEPASDSKPSCLQPRWRVSFVESAVAGDPAAPLLAELSLLILSDEVIRRRRREYVIGSGPAEEVVVTVGTSQASESLAIDAPSYSREYRDSSCIVCESHHASLSVPLAQPTE